MSLKNAQLIRDQAARAGVKLPEFVKKALNGGSCLDPQAQVDLIRLHLNEPEKARNAGEISRTIIGFAKRLMHHQRPWDVIKGYIPL